MRKINTGLMTALFMLMVMTATVSGQTSKAAGTSDVYVNSFDDIAAMADSSAEGDVINYHLSGDIEFGRAVPVKKGVTISLLNDSGGDVVLTVGGGIYFVGGTLTLSDGMVTNNHAEKGGGGILANAGALVITGSAEISGNSSDIVGGGIYGYTSPNVTIEGNARVTDNHAYCLNDPERLYGGGGGVALYATNLTIGGNAVISGNTATRYGGGVWTYPDYTPISTITVTGGLIENNSAKDGGGIWVYALEALTANSVVFTENKADTGYVWDVDNPHGAVQIEAAAIHKASIIDTNYTVPFTNAYSNYDVNFKEGTPLTETPEPPVSPPPVTPPTVTPPTGPVMPETEPEIEIPGSEIPGAESELALPEGEIPEAEFETPDAPGPEFPPKTGDAGGAARMIFCAAAMGLVCLLLKRQRIIGVK